jgi:hypothetical protein
MNELFFSKKNVKAESFSGKDIDVFNSMQSEFTDCQFNDMNIKQICFGSGSKKSLFKNCNFDNSVFSAYVPGIARFENCSFKNIKVKDFFAIDIEMVNCIFSGEIKKGFFSGLFKDEKGRIYNREYRDNDFSGLKLKYNGWFSFRNIDLNLNKFPISDDLLLIYDLKSFLEKVKNNADKIEDNGIRRDLLEVLSILSMETLNNQLFLERYGFPENLQYVMNLLFVEKLYL